jgi:hypothetical protein
MYLSLYCKLQKLMIVLPAKVRFSLCSSLAISSCAFSMVDSSVTSSITGLHLQTASS